VQKKLPYITRELFLGKDATICTLYPSMETMKDAILHTFAIPEEDKNTTGFSPGLGTSNLARAKPWWPGCQTNEGYKR
jgi:hypothetical protein